MSSAIEISFAFSVSLDFIRIYGFDEVKTISFAYKNYKNFRLRLLQIPAVIWHNVCFSFEIHYICFDICGHSCCTMIVSAIPSRNMREYVTQRDGIPRRFINKCFRYVVRPSEYGGYRGLRRKIFKFQLQNRVEFNLTWQASH